MKRLFIHATILTMKDGEKPLTNAALAVENDRITYVGPVPEDRSGYDEVIDMSGHAILPGWVNTHGHAAMSLLRGYGDDLPLKTWLEEKMWPMEARFGPEQVRWGTALTVLEMIKGGTTCFLDMYDHMDQVAEVVVEAGIRARLCRGAIGLCSEEEQVAKWKEAVQFARDWHNQADGRITTMMAPHAPYTCSPDFIRRFVESAAEYQLPIHTHMSETAAEVQQNVDQYGVRPVEHLDKLGVFDLPCLVAHAVHLTDDEIALLAEKDVKVSHNPGSNLKLGSGIAPIAKMLAHGMRPSLGTDGPASNNNVDMLEEIRLAALIHKGANEDPLAVTADVALRMGTIYGAEALFLDREIGTLEPGKKADFITVELRQAHLQPLHDVESHLAYAAVSTDVRDVYVDGRPIMKDRECLTLDEERIIYEANRAFQAIAP
ncbi:5-methylthioadenosine/S-adenosylhomocysteine deaminase [Polycladomyces abyssicola]|uniref:5-methylthioadenosine/S-adenosylhomocysteine deaminase n=2 Tax=Polycladomyces abyssicola TaxID=1125966 RepID=A0A8D5ZNY1_9BACL|nr:5-methylthioadenosine/S-adenosylhomocysteine deaminase [Polycladomyces abyssicola]